MTRKDEGECYFVDSQVIPSCDWVVLFLAILELNTDSCDIQLSDMDANKLFILNTSQFDNCREVASGGTSNRENS